MQGVYHRQLLQSLTPDAPCHKNILCASQCTQNLRSICEKKTAGWEEVGLYAPYILAMEYHNLFVVDCLL